MGKGGRYLKKEKKKGRGWKIALIVLAVVLLLIGGGVFAAVRYYNSMLDKIPRAEIVDKGASIEDIMDAATYNPDKFATEEAEPVADITEHTTLPTEQADEGAEE